MNFFTRHGIRGIEIYTVYQVKQSHWLAKYNKNKTEQGRKEKTEFENSFCKLMNNSFCGKTIENIRKRLNFDLIDKSDTGSLQSKMFFNDIFSEYEQFNLY